MLFQVLQLVWYILLQSDDRGVRGRQADTGVLRPHSNINLIK